MVFDVEKAPARLRLLQVKRCLNGSELKWEFDVIKSVDAQ